MVFSLSRCRPTNSRVDASSLHSGRKRQRAALGPTGDEETGKRRCPIPDFSLSPVDSADESSRIEQGGGNEAKGNSFDKDDEDDEEEDSFLRAVLKTKPPSPSARLSRQKKRRAARSEKATSQPKESTPAEREQRPCNEQPIETSTLHKTAVTAQKRRRSMDQIASRAEDLLSSSLNQDKGAWPAPIPEMVATLLAQSKQSLVSKEALFEKLEGPTYLGRNLTTLERDQVHTRWAEVLIDAPKSTNDKNQASEDSGANVGKKGMDGSENNGSQFKVQNNNANQAVATVVVPSHHVQETGACQAMPKESATTKRSSSKKPKATKPSSKQESNVSVTESRSEPMKNPKPSKRASKATQDKKSRKPRISLCALCSTCVCQSKKARVAATSNVDADDDGTRLATAALVRSQNQMERTLIRRIQKLEKQSEQQAIQLEVAQRRLKQFRRDQWKRQQALRENRQKQQRVLDGNDYFLPDSEKSFDDVQVYGQSVLQKEACDILYPPFPKRLKQASMIQLLGISRKGQENAVPKQCKIHGIAEEKTLATITEECAFDGNENRSIAKKDHAQLPSREDETMEYIKRPLIQASPEIRITRRHASLNTCQLPSLALSQSSISITNEKQLVANGDSSLGISSLDWDELFREKPLEESAQPNDGMNELLQLLESVGNVAPDESHGSQTSPCLDSVGNIAQDESYGSPSSQNQKGGEPGVTMSQLSQGGKRLVLALVENLEIDSETKLLVERECPDWKENIAYTAKQQSRHNLAIALQRVQNSRNQLAQLQDRISKRVDDQTVVLNFFERTIQSRIEALDAKQCLGVSLLSESIPTLAPTP